MLFLRKVIFYLFLAVYLVFCPILILYALGYFFRPGMERAIVKTGLISASTAPAGAAVYLDKKKVSSQSPVLIRDLLPGQYQVSFELPGYRPWTQTVPVEAGKATALDRVLLLPVQLEKEVLSDLSYSGMIPLPDAGFFLLTGGKTLAEAAVYEKDAKKPRPLLPPESPWGEAEIAEFYPLKESRYFLALVRLGGKERYLWFDLREKADPARDISHLFLERPQKIFRIPSAPETIFTLTAGRLTRMDVRSQSVFRQILRDVRGLGFHQKWIYALQPAAVIRTDLEGGERRTLLEDRETFLYLFGEESFFEIRGMTKDIFLFLGEEGKLVTNRLPYTLAERGVEGMHFYEPKTKVASWTSREIGVFDFTGETAGKRFFETGPRIRWVYRGKGIIEEAFWVYEGSYLLFREGRKVSLLEFETYGRPRIYDLFEVKEGSSIHYSEESGLVYFLDAGTGQFAAVEILPKKKILFFPFPELEEERKESEIQEA